MNNKYEIYAYYEDELRDIIEDIEYERQDSFWRRIKDWFKELLNIDSNLRKYQ